MTRLLVWIRFTLKNSVNPIHTKSGLRRICMNSYVKGYSTYLVWIWFTLFFSVNRIHTIFVWTEFKQLLSVSVNQNQVTVERWGGWLWKKNVFSACVIGAGDVGWDCSPSPPSSLLHSTAVNKSIIKLQRQSLWALTIMPAQFQQSRWHSLVAHHLALRVLPYFRWKAGCVVSSINCAVTKGGRKPGRVDAGHPTSSWSTDCRRPPVQRCCKAFGR